MRALSWLIAAVSLLPNLAPAQTTAAVQPKPAVYYTDSSRTGRPFVKDPSVIQFHGTFFMYYTLPPNRNVQNAKNVEGSGWGIGIASSKDLIHWQKAGEIAPEQPVEQDGIVAPGARVIRGEVHLFYQSYGHGAKDAICHATSSDGLHFKHDASNPVYRPTHMPWSVGRAIDAEVFLDEPTGKAFLYFATRDPQMKRQLIGMAKADLSSDFSAGTWKDVSIAGPLLQPELPWEQLCIEAPSVMKRGSTYYMFYAGAYNNVPQQIGVASSPDGEHWTRLSDRPLLANGAPGSWNSSESGHPGVLNVGGKTYLFYQGNDDGGKTYYISMVEIRWKDGKPYVSTDPIAPVHAD
ncbi:glycoside hydrolase family 43 protein [Terriglobus sp.]|uniref:glycoside hydrolase family 43 protein n=1 Tax=Terriglobus sp. TaxID=1889013 RepID=UPI003B00D4BF